MRANYHTHTSRCHHAFGTPEEFFGKAIQSKIEILGFSDHVPMKFTSNPNHSSSFRMDVSEIPDYVGDLAYLEEKYKNDIKIYIGYEAEYYPKEFSQMFKTLTKFRCDYLLLGQHFTQNEYDGVRSTEVCGEEDLKQYVNQVTEGMKTGVFTYITHPDVINYPDDDDIYRREMSRLCDAALKYDMPLEYNLLGVRQKRHYPNKAFWDIVASAKNKVIIGSDSHTTNSLGNYEEYDNAVLYLTSKGITPLETIKIKL